MKDLYTAKKALNPALHHQKQKLKKEKEKLNEVLETLQKLYSACENIEIYGNLNSIIPAMIKAEEVYKKYTKNNISNVN